ncbi:MAG: DUF4276 family protein [Chloroflexi bacterium CFX4]|nr:DUF4276 family protein [Chloroflexi bacterium CFX4]MDL1923493.1 DUF4276 family protein [Chloroflexi bacterium CFX3]
MLRLELLLEDESTETALRILVPKIVGGERARAVRYRSFRGKYTLLKELPILLKGYTKRIRQGEKLRVLVLVDRDVEDCETLKQKLETIALQAGLITRSMATADKPFQILNRIAVEELEAWFFGDIEALCAAYPKVRSHLSDLARRDPDSIPRGTAEALERLLKKAGYYKNGMPKIEVAQRIANHMQLDRNRSRSFQVFREGLGVCLI